MIENKFIGNSGKAKPQNTFLSTHTLIPNGRTIERKDIEAGTARVKAARDNPGGVGVKPVEIEADQPAQVVEEVKDEPVTQTVPEKTAEVEPDAIIIDKTEEVPAKAQQSKRARKGKGSK